MQQFLDASPLWMPGMIAMLICVCCSALFSASETALFYLSYDQLREYRIGKRRERLIAKLMQDPDELLTVILFWNLVINLLFFAISIVVASRLNGEGLTMAGGIYALFSLLLIIVFGEVVPKSIAVAFPSRISLLVSWVLAFMVRIMKPIVPRLRNVTRLIRRTFWPNLAIEPYLETRDLERAVANSQGPVHTKKLEQQLIHRLIKAGETTVEEMMRPRWKCRLYSRSVTLEELEGTVPSGGYLLLGQPHHNLIEQAIPLRKMTSITNETLLQQAEDVVYVPWCSSLATTWNMMRNRKLGLAVIVDEYGEMIGIITEEDILSWTMAPSSSRVKRVLDREPILEIAPEIYHVEGLMSLRRLCELLEVSHEQAGDGTLTVTGLLQEQLERIPQVGDQCRWGGMRFKVIDAANPSQLRAMVSLEEESE